MNDQISLIGVPMWLGQNHYGTNLGPTAICNAGLQKRLKAMDYQVMDAGEVPIGTAGRGNEPRLKNLKAIAAASDRVAQKVAHVVGQGRFPLILGGDHSISIGTLSGIAHYYRNLGVIWYDAHADINTPETTPSGNIHGMPVAANLGLGHPLLTGIGGYQPKIRPENLVYIGLRDVDQGEIQLLDRYNIKVYSMAEVQRLGMNTVMNEAVDYLARRCDGIHLSFDVDGIDPQDIAAVGTPVAGGISYYDSLQALEQLFACGRITSAEFVEVNPLLDEGQLTVERTVNLIGALFGETAEDRAFYQNYPVYYHKGLTMHTGA